MIFLEVVMYFGSFPLLFLSIVLSLLLSNMPSKMGSGLPPLSLSHLGSLAGTRVGNKRHVESDYSLGW